MITDLFTNLFLRPFYKHQNDMKLKIMTGCVNLLKDPNTNVVFLSMECLEEFMESHADIFRPACQLSLDLVVARLNDTKVSSNLILFDN